MYVASIYLETSESVKPSDKVDLIGSFTKKPWTQKFACIYDNLFKCFKADKVKIKIGQQFKFVVNDGRLYLNSARYPVSRDQSGGNFNNFYDPLKLRTLEVNKKKKLSQLKQPLTPNDETTIEPPIHQVWNARIGAPSASH